MNGQALVRADIPLPGGGVAVYAPGGLTNYAWADWLGSSRLQSTPNSTLWWSDAVAPYGESYSAGAAQYFTGKAQDIASGTYDFPMREYSPVQSRWWTPDPAGVAAVDPNDPQTWNRYAYVGGTPLRAVDPLGLFELTLGTCVYDVQSEFVNGQYEGTYWDVVGCANDPASYTLPSSGDTASGGNSGGDPTSQQTPTNSNSSQTVTPHEPFLQCVNRNDDELNPADLIGLGGSSVARGLLSGPLSTGVSLTSAALYGGSYAEAAAGIAGNTIGPASTVASQYVTNPTVTSYPYITTLTENPAITTHVVPVQSVLGGVGSFFEKINPIAIAVDAAAVSLSVVGCAAFGN